MSQSDAILRLLAAVAAGIVIGLNRDVAGKPLGMRTLALVALGAALVAISSTEFIGLHGDPGALARVVQGTLTGVLAGIGFIGAGAILRDRVSKTVEGLTTAATVWVTAALGIACGLGAWPLVGAAVAITLVVLFGMRWCERWFGLKGEESREREH